MKFHIQHLLGRFYSRGILHSQQSQGTGVDDEARVPAMLVGIDHLIRMLVPRIVQKLAAEKLVCPLAWTKYVARLVLDFVQNPMGNFQLLARRHSCDRVLVSRQSYINDSNVYKSSQVLRFCIC